MDHQEKIIIPTEPISSMPRPEQLLAFRKKNRLGRATDERLNDFYNRALQTTIEMFEAVGSEVVTDGEQTKPSFLTYPIYDLFRENYEFSQDCFHLKFADGYQRSLPRLIKAPFRYAKYAYSYMDVTKKFTHLPIKQAVISPSALSMVYPIATIKGYSHRQFMNDLLNESEKDIRLCLEKGAHCVQIDFPEAGFALEIDPSGKLLRDLVRINNEVLERFNIADQHRLGVHICRCGDRDITNSNEFDYLKILPILFELHVGNFYLEFAREKKSVQLLSCIRDYMHPWHRVFIGVTNPDDSRIETPEEICSRILEATKYIPIEQLGTTDDCGFAPFNDDQTISREVAFAKIRARIEGTHMAERQLMMKKQRKKI